MRYGATWTFRLAACAAGVLAIAAPAVWLAGRVTTTPATPVPQSGRVLLSSNPSGSSVFIDGVESGKTPLTATLPAGPHTIEYRYRKNVRKIELTVVTGQDLSSMVDWTRKPSASKRVKPAEKPAEASNSRPEASSLKPEASSDASEAGSLKSEGGGLKSEASSVTAEASSQKPEALGLPEASSPKPEAESREPVHQ